eukprot:926109-Alexandrium_andersonii.AAC.1
MHEARAQKASTLRCRGRYIGPRQRVQQHQCNGPGGSRKLQQVEERSFLQLSGVVCTPLRG